MKRMVLFAVFTFLLLASWVWAQDTLYVETFANGVAQNPWYAGFNANGAGNVMEPYALAGNPSGDGWVGRLSTWREADTGSVAQSFSGDENWADFYYEAQVFIPATGGIPFTFFEFYGLEFRVDSSGNTAGFQFIATFNPNSVVSPRLRFRKRPIEAPASPIILKEWQGSEIPGGAPTTDGWHKMAVRAVGDSFWFYFDDQELPGGPFTDTTSTIPLTHGWIGTYVFKMNFTNPLDTTVLYIDDVVVTSVVTGIEKPEPPLVTDFQLHQNYPNPFNPSTTISFTLPTRSNAVLEIFNTLGQKVRTLANGTFEAGTHEIQWNATDDFGNLVPAGVYYYQLRAGDYRATRKMLLIK